MTHEKTNPILLSASSLMTEYSLATGAFVGIYDHNYAPIPERLAEMTSEKNICIFCITHKKHIDVKSVKDLGANPCKEMHIDAVRESHRSGGSHSYTCPLGFMFWASPVYLNERFIGVLFGSGFLGKEKSEVHAAMSAMCEGKIPEAELAVFLNRFPHAEPRTVKAFAELLLVCAQSLSIGSEGCHEAVKRRSIQQSDLAARVEELKNRYPPGSPPPEYPLDRERKLLDALRRGDTVSAGQLLCEILAVLVFTNPDQFNYIRYRAIELAVLLSRVGIRKGFTLKTMLENDSRNLLLIQKSKNIEELTDTMHMILDDLAAQIHSFQGVQHALALKKAEDFILENFTRKISLEEIAGASGFSAPYFSTIFKEEMGENLSNYLKRLRVEKAASLLTDTALSLSDIAHTCGFEDQSWFSKIFKLYTGKSPGKYRSQGGKFMSKIPETGFAGDYPARDG